MNKEKIDIALSPLQTHPAAAAALLEQQPLQQVADFLGSLPHTQAAPVLAKMLPQQAARLCRLMPAATVAGMLSQLEASLIAAIMRHCGDELGRRLLDMLPDKTRLASRLLLNYSEDAVGAWMSVNVSTLPDDCGVEEALMRIAQEQSTIDLGASLVVDRDRYLKGVASHVDLLRAPADTPVSAVMRRAEDSISARTALKSAQENPLWAQQDSIPVVNRNHKLVGVLRHLDLRHGLEQISTSIMQPPGNDPVSNFFDVYGNSLLLLFTTLNDIARSKARQRR